jgi:uncharacterized DUF497 family protein
MDDIERLLQFTGFEWNKGNVEKNWLRHKVSPVECEQIFFNQPLIILDDPKHSISEKRFAAFGYTDEGRLLAVIFTKRARLLRVISARDMNRKEKKFYEENKEKTDT